MWCSPRQTRLARNYTQSIQAIYDNLQSLTVRITVCSYRWWFLRSNTWIGSIKQSNGNKLRGVRTTGVPFKFGSSCCQQPTQQFKLVSADKMSHISHVVVNAALIHPRYKKKNSLATELLHGGFQTPFQRRMSPGSPLKILSRTVFHFSADTASKKTRQEGCQLCR